MWNFLISVTKNVKFSYFSYQNLVISYVGYRFWFISFLVTKSLNYPTLITKGFNFLVFHLSKFLYSLFSYQKTWLWQCHRRPRQWTTSLMCRRPTPTTWCTSSTAWTFSVRTFCSKLSKRCRCFKTFFFLTDAGISCYKFESIYDIII